VTLDERHPRNASVPGSYSCTCDDPAITGVPGARHKPACPLYDIRAFVAEYETVASRWREYAAEYAAGTRGAAVPKWRWLIAAFLAGFATAFLLVLVGFIVAL
jgi:hypothetical protein